MTIIKLTDLKKFNEFFSDCVVDYYYSSIGSSSDIDKNIEGFAFKDFLKIIDTMDFNIKIYKMTYNESCKKLSIYAKPIN